MTDCVKCRTGTPYYCDRCGGLLGDTPYGTLSCYGCDARAEVERLRDALEQVRLHTEGQVSQYARARMVVAGIARDALGLPATRQDGAS